MDTDFRVAVLVCAGISRQVSIVVRQAAYMLKQDRPDKIVLVSSAAWRMSPSRRRGGLGHRRYVSQG